MRLIVLDESPWWGAAGKGLTEIGLEIPGYPKGKHC